MTDHTKKDKKPATTEEQNKTEAQNDKETQKNSEIQRLHSEIQGLQEKCKEYLEGWKRAKADYINREREIERQRSEWLEFANVNLILEILPIYESFEQLLKYQNKKPANTETQNDEETQKESQGLGVPLQRDSEIQGLQELEQIKKQFDDFFKKLGVEKIKTIGEKFNPDFHEAVERESTNSKEQRANSKEQIANNIITKEVSPGYTMNGKVIKVAKVIVK